MRNLCNLLNIAKLLNPKICFQFFLGGVKFIHIFTPPLFQSYWGWMVYYTTLFLVLLNYWAGERFLLGFPPLGSCARWSIHQGLQFRNGWIGRGAQAERLDPWDPKLGSDSAQIHW